MASDDDYDDDSDDEVPEPPPSNFQGVFQRQFPPPDPRVHAAAIAEDEEEEEDDDGIDGSSDEDAVPPPPPPEGFVGVFRQNMGMHAANAYKPPPPAQPNPNLPAPKGSARAWAEQKVAQARRGTDAAADGAGHAEYDDDDSEADEEASQYIGEDESGRKAMRPADREKAQQMAMMQANGGKAPKADGKGRLDGIAAARQDQTDDSVKPELKKQGTLGRWGTGGDGVRDDVAGMCMESPW